jgi:hypothetical protein
VTALPSARSLPWPLSAQNAAGSKAALARGVAAATLWRAAAAALAARGALEPCYEEWKPYVDPVPKEE